MKRERRGSAPPSTATATADSAQALREENERLRARWLPKKIAGLDSIKEISGADKAYLITRLRLHHKLANLLQVAGLARSTFYYQCQAIGRTEQQSNMAGKIRAVYEQHKGRYGYGRIMEALRNSMAEPVNHKCVQRLMQKMGLRALIRAKRLSRHVPGISNAHVPNVLERDFCAAGLNQKWVTDITEFNLNGHKLYLSACMDLYNGEIIEHQMASVPSLSWLPAPCG